MTISDRPLFSRGRKARGFTLIEMMLVVAVVAILMAIALPTYLQSVRKTNRADAKAVLMEIAQFMDRYYTTNSTFVGATPLYTVSPKGASATDKRYDISFTTASPLTTPTTFTIQAIPANMQTGDSCGTLSITNTGVQSPATAGCW